MSMSYDYKDEPGNLEGGYSRQYTIDELVDLVNAELTMDCALPQILPIRTIRRVITTQAQPWFYQNYRYAVHESYYFIHRGLLETEEFTRYKWMYLPQEIQSVKYLYRINKDSLYQLGLNAPNLSINLGVTNQPYLSSYVTTIGELGVYKTVLDNFSDMLNHFTLFTVKFDYNQPSNRLHILTNVREHLVAECYANIEPQHLYADPLFIDYVMGMCKMKIGEMVGRFDFKLPGDVTYNSSMMLDEGRQLKDKVEETVKGMQNSDFFYLVKK
jgi:hypothetical protein